MTTVLPYLTANSFIRYPFQDQVSLRADNGTVLKNDFIVDLQLVGPGTSAYLQSIVDTVFTFALIQEDDTELLVAVNVASNSAKYAVNTGATDKVSAKLVVGNFVGGLNLTFARGTSTVLNSCFIPPLPKVTKVSFKNYLSAPLAFISPTQSVSLQNGYNVTSLATGSALTLAVQAKGGLGLYNPCTDSTNGAIRKINNVIASTNGNFNLYGGNCIEVDSSHLTNEIFINHTCKARCGEKEVQAFGYYVNRLRDGLNTVMTDVSAVKAKVDSLMSDYRGQATTNTLNNVPYLDAAYAKTSTTKNDYYSLITAINNVSKGNISYNVGLDTDATVLPNTTFITTANTNQAADDETISRNLLTGKVAYYESTASQSLDNTGPIYFSSVPTNTKLELPVIYAQAGAYPPIMPSADSFCVVWKVPANMNWPVDRQNFYLYDKITGEAQANTDLNWTFVKTSDGNLFASTDPTSALTVFANCTVGRVFWTWIQDPPVTTKHIAPWMIATDSGNTYESFKAFPLTTDPYVVVNCTSKINSSGTLAKIKVDLLPNVSGPTSLLVEQVNDALHPNIGSFSSPKLYVNAVPSTHAITVGGYDEVTLEVGQQNYFEVYFSATHQFLPSFKISFTVGSRQFVGYFGCIGKQSDWLTSRTFFRR